MLTARGNMMYASTKFPSPNDVAHLISTYILSSDTTCLKFFYWINSGVLNVKVWLVCLLDVQALFIYILFDKDNSLELVMI